MSKVIDAPTESSPVTIDINEGFAEFQAEQRESRNKSGLETETPLEEDAPGSEPVTNAEQPPAKPKQEPLTDEQRREQKRLSNERRHAERERELNALKAENERLKAEKAAPPAESAPATAKKSRYPNDDPNDPWPKQEEFTDFDDYVDARAARNARAVYREQQAETAAASAKIQEQTTADTFMDEVATYAKDHPSIVGTGEEPGHLTIVGEELENGLQDVSRAIMDDERRVEIIDFLGSHPETFDKILAHRGNQTKALIELGRIMASEFDTPATPAEPSPVRRLPKPPAPVPGRGHTPSGEAALDAAAEANDYTAAQRIYAERRRKR